MVADTVIHCHTKKFKKTALFVWYLKKKADSKMIHDENDVLTDDELVAAGNVLKNSKHACLYI